MIVEVEDTNGNTLGYFRITGTSEFDSGFDFVDEGNISLADIEYDDLMGTNDCKIRVQLEK